MSVRQSVNNFVYFFATSLVSCFPSVRDAGASAVGPKHFTQKYFVNKLNFALTLKNGPFDALIQNGQKYGVYLQCSPADPKNDSEDAKYRFILAFVKLF